MSIGQDRAKAVATDMSYVAPGVYSNSHTDEFGFLLSPSYGRTFDHQAALRLILTTNQPIGTSVRMTTIASSSVSKKLNNWSKLPEGADQLHIDLRNHRTSYLEHQNHKDFYVLLSINSPVSKQRLRSHTIENQVCIQSHLEQIGTRHGFQISLLSPTILETLWSTDSQPKDTVSLTFRLPRTNTTPSAPDLSHLSSDYLYSQTFTFLDQNNAIERFSSRARHSSTLPFLQPFIGRREYWEGLKQRTTFGDPVFGTSTQITLKGEDLNSDVITAIMEMTSRGYIHQRTQDLGPIAYPSTSERSMKAEPSDYIPCSEAYKMGPDIVCKGNGVSGIPLRGRNNQIAFFDNFRYCNNANIAIAANAGSGLEFFLKEFLIGQAATGARCFSIDTEGRMQGITELIRGSYRSETTSKGINPFSTIRETDDSDLVREQLRSISLLLMVLADVENDAFFNHLRDAVCCAWVVSKNTALISDVVEILSLSSDESDLYLANCLADYGDDGRFSTFFTLDAQSFFEESNHLTLSIGNNLVSRDLFHGSFLAIVLMLLATLERENPLKRKIFLFPQAWRIFNVSSPGASLLEGLYRIVRNRGGAIITSTSSMTDFMEGKLARRVFQHSNWKMFFRQPLGFEGHKKCISETLNINPDFLSQIERLKIVDGQYSEFALLGDGLSDTFQFLVDPFTYEVYRKKPGIFATEYQIN